MNAVITQGPAMFWTEGYGAFRWDAILTTRPGTWYLVTLNLAFDQLRGVHNDDRNITCVVDDFGNLVRVPA